MNNNLSNLSKRINFILEEKELPENVKKEIERVYQEYRMFYEEYIKLDIKNRSQLSNTRIIEEYFEENYRKAMAEISKKYKDRCEEKAEVTTIVLETEEIQKEKSNIEQIEKTEMDILRSNIKNDKANYMFTNYIVDKVIDSIGNSRNQLFRILEELKTDKNRMQYIYERIKLIENTAKLRLGELKTELDIDDEQILRQIFDEYEQYKENKEKNEQDENQNAHQKFVNEYRVSKEDLQEVPKINEDNSNIQEKECEELPGNAIE